MKRSRVPITLDLVTKEIADAGERLSDIRCTSTLYPIDGALCESYLNEKT
jgi:hypothetical protein